MPTSAEAFFQALTAFRDRDPNGNGRKDEIGIAFWVFSGPTNGLKLLTPWFGFMTDSREIFLDGNTVKYAPFMPEYVEFLKYCNRLYREGLIDPEFFTLTSQQVVAKGSGAEDIYGAIGTSAAFLIVGPDKAPAFEATPLFVPPNGNVMWYNRNYATPGVGVISASSRYPEALVRWCNLFYTSEYRKIGWMGFEGEAYQWKTDGTWDWKFRSPADTAAAVRGELTIQGGNPGPFLCPPEWFNLAGEVEAPVNAQRVTLANTGKLRLAMPNLYYEQADLRTINTIAADLRLYESQSFAQFVTGEMNIDRDYTAFVAQLRRMDADNMVSLIQKTYNANR
jgi:putative aldouronate transport system substrate-binding protein